jgi:hypothetical protein
VLLVPVHHGSGWMLQIPCDWLGHLWKGVPQPDHDVTEGGGDPSSHNASPKMDKRYTILFV